MELHLTGNMQKSKESSETLFSCYHCKKYLGRLTFIIESDSIKNHSCFDNCEDVKFDFDKYIVYTAEENNVPATAGSDMPKRNKDGETWTDNMVRLLIDSYRLHQNKLDSPMYNKKKFFECISKDLAQHGYVKSSYKCDEMWRNLKKMYEKVKVQNNYW